MTASARVRTALLGLGVALVGLAVGCLLGAALAVPGTTWAAFSDSVDVPFRTVGVAAAAPPAPVAAPSRAPSPTVAATTSPAASPTATPEATSTPSATLLDPSPASTATATATPTATATTAPAGAASASGEGRQHVDLGGTGQ